MWASLWSQAIPHGRNSHTKSHACSPSLEHSLVSSLVLHKQHPHSRRPALGHLDRGRDIQPVDDPGVICLWAASMPQQVSADTEQGCPNACEFWGDNVGACWVLLVFCV